MPLHPQRMPDRFRLLEVISPPAVLCDYLPPNFVALVVSDNQLRRSFPSVQLALEHRSPPRQVCQGLEPKLTLGSPHDTS